MDTGNFELFALADALDSLEVCRDRFLTIREWFRSNIFSFPVQTKSEFLISHFKFIIRKFEDQHFLNADFKPEICILTKKTYVTKSIRSRVQNSGISTGGRPMVQSRFALSPRLESLSIFLSSVFLLEPTESQSFCAVESTGTEVSNKALDSISK